MDTIYTKGKLKVSFLALKGSAQIIHKANLEYEPNTIIKYLINNLIALGLLHIKF